MQLLQICPEPGGWNQQEVHQDGPPIDGQRGAAEHSQTRQGHLLDEQVTGGAGQAKVLRPAGQVHPLGRWQAEAVHRLLQGQDCHHWECAHREATWSAVLWAEGPQRLPFQHTDRSVRLWQWVLGWEDASFCCHLWRWPPVDGLCRSRLREQVQRTELPAQEEVTAHSQVIHDAGS